MAILTSQAYDFINKHLIPNNYQLFFLDEVNGNSCIYFSNKRNEKRTEIIMVSSFFVRFVDCSHGVKKLDIPFEQMCPISDLEFRNKETDEGWKLGTGKLEALVG